MWPSNYKNNLTVKKGGYRRDERHKSQRERERYGQSGMEKRKGKEGERNKGWREKEKKHLDAFRAHI